jgi:hypothetical protein
MHSKMFLNKTYEESSASTYLSVDKKIVSLRFNPLKEKSCQLSTREK